MQYTCLTFESFPNIYFSRRALLEGKGRAMCCTINIESWPYFTRIRNWKLIFARTYAFESSRRNLHNALCDLPRTRLSNFYHKMTKSSSTLLECSQQGSKGSLRYVMWGYTGVSLQPSWTSRSRWYANEARRMFRMHLH